MSALRMGVRGYAGAMPTALRGHGKSDASVATQSSCHGILWLVSYAEIIR